MGLEWGLIFVALAVAGFGLWLGWTIYRREGRAEAIAKRSGPIYVLLRNLYTSIPHDGAMLNLVFLAAGWTGRLLGSLDLAYQLMRVLAVVMLAWSVWLFVATFTDLRERRRWLFLAVVFGAGIGWMLKPIMRTLSTTWEPLSKLPEHPSCIVFLRLL